MMPNAKMACASLSFGLLMAAAPAGAASDPAHRFCGGAVVQTVPSDLEHAIGELTLERVAEQSEPGHLFCLYGYVAEKCGDHETALAIFDRCVAQGHAGAMIWEASMYEDGHGVPPDLAHAADLYRRAAQADRSAYSTLGKLHYATVLYLGRGVDRDEREAHRWFCAAARDGDPDARRFLETGYHTAQRDAAGRGVGRGVPQPACP